MFPVYGMAEASLAITFPPVEEEFITINLERSSISIGQTVKEITNIRSNAVTFIDLGYPIEDNYIRICDVENNIYKDGTVGYIQIKGRNVTCGYYNNQNLTSTTITEDGWLNTGDVGFIRDGRLIVTGRAKDILFVNGQNYYPDDIERVAQEIEGIDLGEIAVCGIFNQELQKDDIYLFVLYKNKLEDFIPLGIKLKKYINKQMGLAIKNVIPILKIPKTTSGKIQRYLLKERFLNGEFSPLIKEIDSLLEANYRRKTVNRYKNGIEKKLLNIFKEIFNIQGQ